MILTIFPIPRVFQVFHVFQVCGHPELYMTHYRFDDFLLMAGKIRVRNTDKGFAVQSSDEALTRCLYGDLRSFGEQKLGNLSDMLTSLNPRYFIHEIWFR